MDDHFSGYSLDADRELGLALERLCQRPELVLEDDNDLVAWIPWMD